MGKQLSRDTVRRVIQLHLEQLSWSNIGKILGGVDREAAMRAYEKNFNNLESFRLDRVDYSKTAANFPHLRFFLIQYAQGGFLIKEKNPTIFRVPIRKTRKTNEAMERKNYMFQYRRCRQLYLEGFEVNEISKMLDKPEKFVEARLMNTEPIEIKKPSLLKSVNPATMREQYEDFGFKNSEEEKFVYYHNDSTESNVALRRSFLVTADYNDYIFP